MSRSRYQVPLCVLILQLTTTTTAPTIITTTTTTTTIITTQLKIVIGTTIPVFSNQFAPGM